MNTRIENTTNTLIERLRANPLFVSGLAATVILGSAWIINDYKQWKAFGTGGTPPNVLGYCRMTILRIVFAYHIPRQTNPKTLSTKGPSYLKDPLPLRAGGRPKLMPRILPQRQVPEPIDASTRDRLMSLMHRLAGEHPDILEVKPSATEGRAADGLYARKDNDKINPIVPTATILDYELAHAHPADNSLHVWLSDLDARKVIEAGWGQMFSLPLAQTGWTMVYAPRNDSELEVVEKILRAGVTWVTNVDV